MHSLAQTYPGHLWGNFPRLSSLASGVSLIALQTFQLSRCGRETHDFRTHLTVSRFNLEISRFFTMNYNLNQIRPKINSIYKICISSHWESGPSYFKVPLRRKFLFLFSPFSRSNPFNEYVIAKLAIN